MLFVYHRSFGSNTPKVSKRRTLGRAGTTLIKVPELPMIAAIAQSLVIGQQAFLEIEIGQSFCHPLDQFSRKIGMKLATERMVKYTFKSVAVLTNYIVGADNKTKLLLCDENDERRGVEIDFNVIENYCRVRVVDLTQQGDANGKQCNGACGC